MAGGGRGLEAGEEEAAEQSGGGERRGQRACQPGRVLPPGHGDPGDVEGPDRATEEDQRAQQRKPKND
ncbi:hypothetical protein [Streptomyces collinus]|uniref:hypothetical protein n=1 Tax=Streptomyces collinus TaxID=42684 RepID=UPI003802B1F2